MPDPTPEELEMVDTGLETPADVAEPEEITYDDAGEVTE